MDKTAVKEQKAKAKQDAADLRENKRLARKVAAEEKAKKKEEKNVGKGKHVSEPSMGSVNTSANVATSANDATDASVAPEPKPKRLRKVQNADPVPESGGHEGVPKTLPDPKQLKVVENFELLKLTGISELQPELGDKKSFSVRPGEGAMIGARAIGVILTTASFYVNKTMLTTDDWPPSLLELYKVGSLWNLIQLIAFQYLFSVLLMLAYLQIHESLLFWPRLRSMWRKAWLFRGTRMQFKSQSPWLHALGSMPRFWLGGLRQGGTDLKKWHYLTTTEAAKSFITILLVKLHKLQLQISNSSFWSSCFIYLLKHAPAMWPWQATEPGLWAWTDRGRLLLVFLAITFSKLGWNAGGLTLHNLYSLYMQGILKSIYIY